MLVFESKRRRFLEDLDEAADLDLALDCGVGSFLSTILVSTPSLILSFWEKLHLHLAKAFARTGRLDGVAHQGHQKVVMVRGHGVLRYQRYEGRTGQVDPQRHVVGPNLRLVENAAESKSDDTGRNLVDAQDEASSRRVAFQRFHRRVVPPAASSRR